MKAQGIVRRVLHLMPKFTGICTIICIVVLASAVIVSAREYTFIDICEKIGSSGCEAFNINNSGQVVGATYNGTGIERGFLYSNEKVTELGTFGGDYSDALGINNSGQVVGVAAGTNKFGHAFLYSNEKMADLGTIGGTFSSAYCINDSGVVAGESTFSSDSSVSHAFLYSNGIMTDLGTLGGLRARGSDINDNGEVVGFSDVANGERHAVLYSKGRKIDLNPIGSSRSRAYGINNSGQVVGWFMNANNSYHAFLYDAGTMIDLGTILESSQSYATDINNSGQVVGYFMPENAGTGNLHIFLYSNGKITDLSSTTNVTSTFQPGPYTGIKINDYGHIVGFVVINGQTTSILLTPVNTPPVFAPVESKQATDGQLLQFTVSATDPDGDSIKYYTEPLPTGAYFDPATMTFSWTPDYNQVGTYTVRFFAEDNGLPESKIADIYVTISVSVPTPDVLIRQIIDAVYAMQFPKPIENSYIANLKKVGEFLNEGKLIPALNQLNATIQKITTDMKKGIISEANGNKLIMMITLLINELNPQSS